MVLKAKNQMRCEQCHKPIRVGQFYDVLAIDNHNMSRTHKIVYTHDYCTAEFLAKI